MAEKAGDAKTAALFQGGGQPFGGEGQPGVGGGGEDVLRHDEPGHRRSSARGLNLANHIDFEYLPGRKYDTFFDPEGYLSTLPAVVTCLLGVFAGLLLEEPDLAGQAEGRAG